MEWYTALLLIVAASVGFLAVLAIVLAATLWLTNRRPSNKRRPRASRRP